MWVLDASEKRQWTYQKMLAILTNRLVSFAHRRSGLQVRPRTSSVAANLFVESDLAIVHSSTRTTKRDSDETRYPSSVRYGDRKVRLRQYIPDPLNPGGDSHRHLRQLPSLFHGQAEARRYCGTRRALPSEVRQASRCA